MEVFFGGENVCRCLPRHNADSWRERVPLWWGVPLTTAEVNSKIQETQPGGKAWLSNLHAVDTFDETSSLWTGLQHIVVVLWLFFKHNLQIYIDIIDIIDFTPWFYLLCSFAACARSFHFRLTQTDKMVCARLAALAARVGCNDVTRTPYQRTNETSEKNCRICSVKRLSTIRRFPSSMHHNFIYFQLKMMHKTYPCLLHPFAFCHEAPLAYVLAKEAQNEACLVNHKVCSKT